MKKNVAEVSFIHFQTTETAGICGRNRKADGVVDVQYVWLSSSRHWGALRFDVDRRHEERCQNSAFLEQCESAMPTFRLINNQRVSTFFPSLLP